MTSDGYSVGKQTTEWHDALVKHGIREKIKKPPSNDAIDTKNYWDEKAKDQYADKSLEELAELEDEIEENVMYFLYFVCILMYLSLFICNAILRYK